MLVVEENALGLTAAERQEITEHPLKYIHFVTLSEAWDEVNTAAKVWVVLSVVFGLLSFLGSHLGSQISVTGFSVVPIPEVLWKFLEGQLIGYLFWSRLNIFQSRKRSRPEWLLIAGIWSILCGAISVLPALMIPAILIAVALLDVVCEGLNKRGYRRAHPMPDAKQIV